eukprot:ctg_1231.g309
MPHIHQCQDGGDAVQRVKAAHGADVDPSPVGMQAILGDDLIAAGHRAVGAARHRSAGDAHAGRLAGGRRGHVPVRQRTAVAAVTVKLRRQREEAVLAGIAVERQIRQRRYDDALQRPSVRIGVVRPPEPVGNLRVRRQETGEDVLQRDQHAGQHHAHQLRTQQRRQQPGPSSPNTARRGCS